MMVSWYSESELEAGKKVSDVDLNELLQEIRALDNRYYLMERPQIIKKRFKKPIQKMLYMLLVDNGGECQIVNFAQDHDYSINTYVTKSYMLTYFYGWLSGHHTLYYP